jgi:CHASE2 domain-containing sensor protein
MEYKNFDLLIDSPRGEQYPLRAQYEAAGDTDGFLVLQPDCLKVAEALKDVGSSETDDARLVEFGASLHKCLFSDGVGDLLRESLGSVRQDDEKGVRIRLMISPPEVAALPWEILYDQRNKCFLSTSGKTPLTRYIRLFEPIKSLKIRPPVRVLVLIPEGSGLDVEKEKALIKEAFATLETVTVTILEGKVTRSRISEALVEEQYHILHFIGHGVFESGRGHLVINSEDGGRDIISDEVFAHFFQDYSSLKLIVLNACQGAAVDSARPLAGMAPQLVLRGIPAVVAMQYPISDPAALLFAKEFYLKLCKGWSRGQVDAAVSHARNRIHMDIGEPLAFATPVLFMRSFTGVIFDLDVSAGPETDEDGSAVKTSTPKSLLKKIFGLFTSQPSKNINRLKEVKKTYEKNIEVLQGRTKDAQPEVAEEAARAISLEREEMGEVDRRIARWERTFGASLLASALIFALGYVGLFNFPFHLDDWLETRFIPYMDEYVKKDFSPDIRLILADQKENGRLGPTSRDWRQYHAQLIEALAAAKARVVVLDLLMDIPNDYDGRLADAIRSATARGARVVTGKALDDQGRVRQDLAEALREPFKDTWGNNFVGGAHGGFVRVYQLAQPVPGAAASSEIPVVPSIGLQAVGQFLSNGAQPKFFFNEDRGEIQVRADGELVRTTPVNENADGLFDFPYDLALRSNLADATRTYSEVYDKLGDAAFLKDYENKIVIVGYKTHGQTFNVLEGEERYGAEINANVISNILNGVYIRLLPSSYDFLIVALMAGVGALVRARFSHVFSTKLTLPLPGHRKDFDVPGLLFLADIVYLLVAFQIYKHGLIFIVKSYHLAAPFITYWLTGRMRKRAGFKLS